MLASVRLAHHSTAISARDKAGCTRYSTDVGLAIMMRRGGIYVDVAQSVEQPRNGLSSVQVRSSANYDDPKATGLTPRKDEGARWCSSVGRASVLYSECRGFDSCHQLHHRFACLWSFLSAHNYNILHSRQALKVMLSVKLVRIQCGLCVWCCRNRTFILGYRQAVRHQTLTLTRAEYLSARRFESCYPSQILR